MSIRITSTGASAPEVVAAEPAKTTDTATSIAAQQKAGLNTAIVQASIDVSISAGTDSLTLVLKSAINGINDALKPEFGDNALQNAMSQDNTPAGTAGRIVSLSTGFFDAYKTQHAGEGKDDASMAQDFINTIRGGFEKGFGEAKDVLKGMQVLNGDIASNIDKTYDLVQKGYADFIAAHSAIPAPAGGSDGALAVSASASTIAK